MTKVQTKKTQIEMNRKELIDVLINEDWYLELVSVTILNNSISYAEAQQLLAKDLDESYASFIKYMKGCEEDNDKINLIEVENENILSDKTRYEIVRESYVSVQLTWSKGSHIFLSIDDKDLLDFCLDFTRVKNKGVYLSEMLDGIKKHYLAHNTSNYGRPSYHEFYTLTSMPTIKSFENENTVFELNKDTGNYHINKNIIDNEEVIELLNENVVHTFKNIFSEARKNLFEINDFRTNHKLDMRLDIKIKGIEKEVKGSRIIKQMAEVGNPNRVFLTDDFENNNPFKEELPHLPVGNEDKILTIEDTEDFSMNIVGNIEDVRAYINKGLHHTLYNEKNIHSARVFEIEKGIVIVKIEEIYLPATAENLTYKNGHEQQFITPHLIVTPSKIYKSDDIKIEKIADREKENGSAKNRLNFPSYRALLETIE